VVLVTCLAALLGVAVLTIPTTRAALASLGSRSRAVAAFSDTSPSPTPAAPRVAVQPPPPAPILRAPGNPDAIRIPGNLGFSGWAFLDRKTGAAVGSANAGSDTSTTESMVKAWIASDYLRLQAAAGRTPNGGTLNELSLMIVDSNDDLAEKYYDMDGDNAVVQRLITMCGLSHTTIYPYFWARTTMTPQDAVRYGNCLGNGTAAGPKWTDWILDTMRHVRGGVNDQVDPTRQGGRWGIIDGLPLEIAAGTSIKNGFTAYKDGWHVNCLAIQRDWVLTVMVRIGNLQSGANACRSVAQQLVVTPEL
jgi:hypothetical protein